MARVERTLDWNTRGFRDLNPTCKVRFSAFVEGLTNYVIRYPIQIRKYDITAVPSYPETMHKVSQTHFLTTPGPGF